MKRMVMAMFLATIFALWGGNVMAETYIVQNGDCLSEISVKELNSYKAWKKIANLNNLSHPYVIRVGQKLEMPTKEVASSQISIKETAKKRLVALGTKSNPVEYIDSNVGADPFAEEPREGLNLLGFEISEGKISFGYRGVEALKEGEIFQMVSGSDKVKWYRNKLTKRNAVNKIAILVEGEEVAVVYQKKECGNWIRRVPMKGSGKPPHEISKVPPRVALVVPPVTREKPSKDVVTDIDSWDWYVGGGNYYNRIGGDDNHGYYAWTKFRIRPWWFKPDENALGIRKIGLGGFGFLAGGEGVAAKHYDYDWHEAVIGVTAKVYAQHSDYDFDVGYGKLWNKGSWMGVEDRDQIDDIFLFSTHGNFYREGEDVEFFPKFELNLEYRLPIDTKVNKGTEADNEVLELAYTQWIYKFEIGDSNSFAVSPGFNFGIGYDKSAEDEDFFKLGPAFEFTSYGNVVAGISLFNYKFQGDGQWHPIGGYVSIDGIWRAYKASQISGVTPEDLHQTEGSKLLRNPGDYLD